MLKLPLLRGLRSARPDTTLTWWAGSGVSVLDGPLQPLAQGLIEKVIKTPLGMRWREWLRPPPRSDAFDTIIDTQRSARVSLLVRRLPHTRFLSPALDQALNQGITRYTPPASRNLVLELKALFEQAIGAPISPGYDYDLPTDLRALASELLPASDTYVGFAPGAGGAGKRWPLEHFIATARCLESQGSRPVFLLGPAEADMRATIGAQLPAALIPEHTQAAIPHKGPLLALALAERLQCAVSNDAGIGHVLAAARIPVVTVFARDNPEKFIDPELPRIALRPRDFRASHVAAIPVDAVVDRVSRCLVP